MITQVLEIKPRGHGQNNILKESGFPSNNVRLYIYRMQFSVTYDLLDYVT